MAVIKKIVAYLKSNKGDLYVQAIVSIILLVTVMSVFLQIAESIQRKIWLDGMTTAIVRNVQINGEITADVTAMEQKIKDKMGSDVTISYEGDFLPDGKRIQLGSMVTIKISTTVKCLKFGKSAALVMPLTCEGEATSEVYWKD